MSRLRSSLLPMFAAFVALLTTRVAPAQRSLGTVTTEHGDRHFEAQIIALEIVTLFKTADDLTPDKTSVIVARGQTVCTPPALTQNKKQLLDPTAYHHVKRRFPVSVEVEPAAKDSDVIVVKGELAFAVDVLQNRMDPSALFLPGAVWKVKAAVNVGYVDEQKKTKLVLKPGTYRIGPYGKFISGVYEEIRPTASAQDNGEIVVEGDPLETLVRVPGWSNPDLVLPQLTKRAEIPSVDVVPGPSSVVWVEPGPREGSIRIITDRSRIPLKRIGKLGLMRETLPKLQPSRKLDLAPGFPPKATIGPILSTGTVIWGATEGPVQLAGERRELLRGHVVGRPTYKPLYPSSMFFWDRNEKAKFNTELEKRWPELKGLSQHERQEFFIKVFELLPPEQRSQDYETEFVRTLKALGAFVQLNDSGGVKIVNLGGKVLTEDLVAQLASLTELEVLWLDGTNVTDADLKHVARLRMLRRLSLRDTEITDAGLKHLTGLTALRDLDLTSTKVTDAGLKRLQALLPDVKICK